MNVLHQIISLYNDQIATALNLGDKAIYYCIADLVKRDDKTFPVVKANNDAVKISPSTNHDLILYHRIIDGPESEIEDGMGDDRHDRFTVKIKTVGFWRSAAFGTEPYTSRDAAVLVYGTPDPYLRLPGVTKSLSISRAGNIQVDDQVWAVEIPEIDAKKANSMRIAAFSYESEVSGILCAGYCV